MCHDIFINLAKTLKDLQLGILIKSTEVILLALSTETPEGVNNLGLVILTDVGEPNLIVCSSELLLV